MRVRIPFSNGTEADAWMDRWCAFCAHDHGMHGANSDAEDCELVMNAMAGLEYPADEAWVAEPDDGKFFLPSRMICLRFTPCTLDACTGDPGAEARAGRVAEVQTYWRERVKS